MSVITYKGEPITLDKVKSFLKGNTLYWYDQLVGIDTVTKEQVFYRIYLCKDTCIPKGECEVCFCDIPERMYVDKPYETRKCKFPDFMSGDVWELYKKENNININEIIKELSEKKQVQEDDL